MTVPAGIYLVAPHAQWIWNGKKKLIVKARKFSKQIHRPLVLCGPSFLWGILSLEAPHDISLVDFVRLKKNHQISEEERLKWWPGKQILYAYQFGFKKFDKPIPWKKPRGVQTFVLDVPLPESYRRMVHSMKFISDIRDYNPRKVKDKPLLDDHRITHAWAAITRTRRFKYPLSLVKQLHDMIVVEMKRRKMFHHTPLNESFAQVQASGNKRGRKVSLEEVLESLEDFKVSSPVAYIVGGLANNGSTEGDIDIQINAPPPDSGSPGAPIPLLPVQFRILRQLPMDLWDRVSFHTNEHGGPFTNHVPIYDLVALRRDPYKILMSQAYPPPLKDSEAAVLFFSSSAEKMAKKSIALDAIRPMRFFYLAKPLHGRTKGEIYSPDSVIQVIKSRKKDWFKIGIVVETKFDGVSSFIHKVGDRVKLWTDDGGDITANVPTLVAEIKKKWKNIPCVVGCELELRLDGKHQPRADTNGVLHSAEPHELESHIRANFYDMLWTGSYESKDMDLHNKPFEERIAFMRRLKQGDHLFRSEQRIVHSEKELRKALDYFSGKPGSEGAYLKLLDFKYPLTGKTLNNMKFKKELSLECRIAARLKVKGSRSTYYYHIALEGGVYAGKTANTNRKVNIGDIVKVVFVDISKYTDPKTGKVWFAMWGPARLHEPRPDKNRADSVAVATRIVEQTTGRIEKKNLPKDARDLIASGKMKLSLASSPPGYMATPTESKKWLGMLQLDSRKKNVGIDFRWQVSNDEIAAFTVFVPKGLSRVPENTSDAKAILSNEIMPLIKDTLSNPLKKFNCQPKNNIKAGKNVFKEIIGVGPGYDGKRFMWTVDSFEIEHGAKKRDFVELFVKSGFVKGRIVFVKIPNREEWTKTPEGDYTWMMFKTSNENPYVLSPRASDKGWVPPQGVSALPASIRRAIPRKLQYWHSTKESERKLVRDALLLAIRKKQLRLTEHKIPISLHYSAPFDRHNFTRTKEGLLIKNVCALGVGAWKGAGMEFAVWNSAEYIAQVMRLCPEKLLLCSEHDCFDRHGNLDSSKGAGYAFNWRLVDGDLFCDIMVINEHNIKLVETEHYKGVSLNTDAFICPERRYATDPISVKELTLCVNPACKVCYFPGSEACPA